MPRGGRRKEGGAATFLRPSSSRSKLELVPCVILETDEKLFAPSLSLPSKLRTFTTQRRRRQRLRWRSECGAAVGRNKSHRKRQKWMKRTFRTFSLALFANFEGKLFTSLLQLAPPRQRQVHQGMKLVNFRIEVNIFLRCAGALFISKGA